MLEEYISRIEEACGEERDSVVILKYAKREEAMRKILEKCTIERSFQGFYQKADTRSKKLAFSEPENSSLRD